MPSAGNGEAPPALWRPARVRLASLYTLSIFGRTVVLTVIPLQAYALLGNAVAVSVAYFLVSATGVVGSLSVPWLVRTIGRRHVFLIGALCFLTSLTLFATRTVPGLVGGLLLQILSIAAVEVTQNLYVMERLPRRQLAHYEPLRVTAAAAAYTAGPWLGVYLGQALAPWVPFALAAVSTLAMLGFFLYLRLTEGPPSRAGAAMAPNPARYVPRYFRQPRLVLAYLLALGRSAWWSMFFVYGPIYVVSAGLGELASGLIVSLANLCLFLVPLWGWLGRRYGFRRLLVTGFALSGLASAGAALAAGSPWVGAGVLVLAALITASLDGAGNVPFLRAVHPYERPEMIAVYLTYRDVGQTVTPGLFALILWAFELPAVFLATGLAMIVLAFYSRYIPRRL